MTAEVENPVTVMETEEMKTEDKEEGMWPETLNLERLLGCVIVSPVVVGFDAINNRCQPIYRKLSLRHYFYIMLGIP